MLVPEYEMPVLFRRSVLLATLPLLLVACSKEAVPVGDDSASTSPGAAMAVTVARVRTREITKGVTVSGAIAPVEEMLLGVELSGLRVTELRVDVGEQVHRGQVLLELDRRMLDSELAQADAALREAEAGAALARANLARGQNLAKDRFISATQLDELRAARTQSEARAGTARAIRDSAALRRSFTELRAPADGIISKRLAQPGQVVASGGELLRMIKDGRLEWRAELPVAQLTSIKPGDSIELITANGTPVPGRVRAVSPGVDTATRTGTVYADLPAPAGLATGTYLEGRIHTSLAQATTAPAAAVVLRDGFPTLFVIGRDGLAHATRVRTGAKVDQDIELLDGPKIGEQVVVIGAGFLADGDKVRVVPSADAASSKTP